MKHQHWWVEQGVTGEQANLVPSRKKGKFLRIQPRRIVHMTAVNKGRNYPYGSTKQGFDAYYDRINHRPAKGYLRSVKSDDTVRQVEFA